MSWYRTGTVAVTNGSKTVTGVGTLWTSAVNAGDAFALVDANLNPTGAWYEVESVTNNTTLVLKQSYAGTTGSNKQYCVFNLVGNMTTPSFAQRLATFFASFQGLIDKPTTTPTASSIPIADSGGKIADGWIPATVARTASPTLTGTPAAPTAPKATNTTQLATTAHVKDVLADYVAKTQGATTSATGVVELATAAEATAGNDTTRAITPSVSGSRITFATTSTDDATSATAAPLKSAGGLAVAKGAWVGGNSRIANTHIMSLGDNAFTISAGETGRVLFTTTGITTVIGGISISISYLNVPNGARWEVNGVLSGTSGQLGVFELYKTLASGLTCSGPTWLSSTSFAIDVVNATAGDCSLRMQALLTTRLPLTVSVSTL